jgi:hypothetical protein
MKIIETLKQKFNKVKFLIILIIGIVLAILANKTGKFDDAFGYVILGIAIWISVMQFRFYFDKKYKEEAIKNYKEQKDCRGIKDTHFILW